MKLRLKFVSEEHREVMAKIYETMESEFGIKPRRLDLHFAAISEYYQMDHNLLNKLDKILYELWIIDEDKADGSTHKDLKYIRIFTAWVDGVYSYYPGR